MISFGERLEFVRKQLGLSQQEFAQLLGVSLRAYTEYVRNRMTPTYEKLIPLAQKGINLHWLLTGEGSPTLKDLKKKTLRGV